MKTQTVTTYTAAELKAQFPEAFGKAFRHYTDNVECNWSDEIFDSLKAVCKAAGVTLRNWSLGAYNRGNQIRVDFPGSNDYDTEHLCGKRAIAWLENNLLGPLRFQGNARIDDWSKHVDAAGKFDSRKIDESAKYYRTDSDAKLHRRHGLPGSIPSCPLTGVCFDEDYLDALRKSVNQGDTLKDAFQGLADVYANLAEAEIESQQTEEYFIEEMEAREVQFTEEGDLF